MSAILRWLVFAPLGFVAACLAAAIAHLMSHGLSAGDLGEPVVGGILGLTTVIFGAVAFLPSVVAIVIAEGFALRSIFYWLGAGVVIAVIGGSFDDAAGYVSLPMIAVGLVGGAVYWLIAGRNAGRGVHAPQDERPD